MESRPRPQTCRWHTYTNLGELSQAGAQRILHSARECIARSGRFSIVLAGGSTPRQVYALLRTGSSDWSRWQVFFGDERCLPADHAERNSRMAAESWLDHVAIPPARIHPIPAELGPQQAAAAYAKALASVPEFDLVLLGLGEDGHTASLFPSHDWGDTLDSPPVLAVLDAPKPPPQRVSLSAARLSQAREVVFLVSGAGKRQAVADWRAGRNIPALAIAPPGGVDVLLDF
ncbi:MAG: 6-phosphogluconolactonase [Betaproteobacteria bacterium]|nr:6-phosphogluconolactonase [Betaproteobacteria bacterium]